jgi:hypothetical protein
MAGGGTGLAGIGGARGYRRLALAENV